MQQSAPAATYSSHQHLTPSGSAVIRSAETAGTFWLTIAEPKSARWRQLE